MKRLIALFLAALMITSVGLSTSKVLAIDEIFYSGNDILFYNPDDKTCSTTNIAASGDNKGNAFNFFVSKGIPAIKSAAIVGNLQQESNVEPRALNSSSGAYGIAQWLGGRKTELLKLDYYTSGATDPTKELQVQL